MFPRILDRVIEWMKAHKQFAFEFEERASHTWVFLRTWRKNSFYRAAVGVIDRCYGDASSELVILGKFLCTIGSGGSLVSISGRSHTLAECYKEYLGSGYIRGLLDYASSDVRLLKRCLQKTVFFAPCLGCSIPFRWPNSWSLVSRALSIVTGCSRDSLCEGQLSQVIFLFLGFRCCQQHNWGVAADFFLPQGDWQEGLRR